MGKRKKLKSGLKFVVRIPLAVVVATLFIITAALGATSGVLFAYAEDLSTISALDDYVPSTISRLLARDGRTVGEFAVQRRDLISYENMAPRLREAIIATEDGDFENHIGLDIRRTVVAVVRSLIPGQPTTGASTITQQVARLLFLQEEYMSGGVFARSGLRGYERKVKEWILALQLEKRYSKSEIFAFYANQSNLGAPGYGAYGVEAAAQLFFGKSAQDVTLDEAATIAAVFQTPARLNPYVNPDQTLARRNNVVLPRMVSEGYITDGEAGEAAVTPIALRGARRTTRNVAPYFAETIRQDLTNRFGSEAVYEAGLVVETTLDVDLQLAANAAIDGGLRALDKRRNGYRGAVRNVLSDGSTLADFAPTRWRDGFIAGEIIPALVTFVPLEGQSGTARIRIDDDEFDLPPSAFAWTRQTSPAAIFSVGDVIDVRVGAVENGRASELTLEQEPEVQGALLAIENASGQILAMVGGSNFDRSEFNRALQARRQVGSLFKPIVYTTAIDLGFTPVSIFIDEPVSFEVGVDQPLYEPQNYDRKYEGPVTLRHALEDSRNVPAVIAMNELGPEAVVSYAARFGFPSDYPPFLSVALGSAEATLAEVTSAYSAFPNRGVRMTPYSVVSVRDREGNLLAENRPQPNEAVRADTAFIMTNLLHGVIQRGTGASANSLDWPLGGKTGTMDDYTDAWFVGFDPTITVGVWVGHDEKRSIGDGETGASAALPIWIEFMRAHIDRQREAEVDEGFEPPGNIVFLRTEDGIVEAFIDGTQPQPEFLSNGPLEESRQPMLTPLR